jgi:apolipoprotein N-acyltransferase
MAPSGEIVGLSSAPLDRTPFRDFLVPGIFLFVVFGLVPAVVCYALYTRRRCGWISSVGVAVAMLVWVLVEVAVGFDRPTTYLNLATAGAIVVLAVHPAVRHGRSDAKRS